MDDILKKLADSADDPMLDGVKAITDLFKERFGDLKPAEQCSIMAFISGGTILDILCGEVMELTKRLGKGPELSFTGAAMTVQTAQRIAADGVASAFSAALTQAKRNPKA